MTVRREERYGALLPKIVLLVLREARKAAFYQGASECRFYLRRTRESDPLFFWGMIARQLGLAEHAPSLTDTRWIVREIVKELTLNSDLNYKARRVTEEQDEYLFVSWR